MAYSRLGARVMLLIGFALVVLVLQMIAVSRISVPPRYPWENEGAGAEGQRPGPAAPAVKKRREDGGTEQSPPLEHENPGTAEPEVSRETRPPFPTDVGLKVKLPRNLKDIHRHLVEEIKLSNVTTPPTTLTTLPSTQTKTHLTRTIPSVKPYPLPRDLRNCDISSKKDAQSAISRATTDDCKALIRNVTCLAQGRKLYDEGIRNMCPIGKNPGQGFQVVPFSQGTGPLARVVFVLSVHGRAYRQAKRMFKAIYHKDHYYYIHVDSRSDYLHRKLYEATADLPNVYFPTWRMATIWGGASLLQMLLRSMQDLEFVLTDWNWDFFINLSESDYPLKTNDELQQFLRVHRKKNFIKTHGGDVNKFIQKQGLDRTFVECDNHMWRVDTRRLPTDITVDGGSDWIAINRNYSQYLVTSEEPYLKGLMRYYEFSLLPAESFFHTVIRNGPMCETFVKTNLRVTNWNRKLGCRCQYKHIVDWCGCSPNDFLTRDIGRLKNTGDHHFFARKFEAIVNQDIVRLLDAHLYGHYPEDMPGLFSYWESVYHVEDDITKPGNARYGAYLSFLRHSLRALYSGKTENGDGECDIPKQAAVEEVSVFREKDEFRGFVVTIKDALSEQLRPTEFEVLFTPVPYLHKDAVDSDVSKRIWTLEVGSNWDGKESIFRNYGNILGVWDEPVAAVRLTMGKQAEAVIVWEDPIGERVATYTMKLEANWFISFHKPKLDKPIRPGVWSVRIEMKDGTRIMQTKFLVIPVTHENTRPLTNPQAANARRANSVHPGVDSKEFLTWRTNVAKAGSELEEWLDELMTGFWKLEDMCRTSDLDGGGQCSWLPECASTSWSTFSPDPKSEIGDVKADGRIR